MIVSLVVLCNTCTGHAVGVAAENVILGQQPGLKYYPLHLPTYTLNITRPTQL